MDPSVYYNSWWNNHNSGSNWYMDPHKSGTLNHPPPAHNMSGPPQHPPHGLPMGQPMAPRALQPGYMAPRPAHTGSSVPIPSKSQPSVLGPKQPHPGGSSSPKPLLPPSSTPPLDKTSMMGVSPKPPATSPNVLSNSSQVGGNKASAPSLVQSNASKTVPNLPQTQYHHLELLQHQQTSQHMQQPQPQQQQQQPVSTHQQLNVSQQQMVMNQQHQSQHSQQQSQTNQQVSQQHQQPLQSHHQQQQVVQQQGNTHCSASAQQVCQNVPPKAPAGPTLGVLPKADATKGPTPPVPDLISIKQPPPASQPIPASPTLKPPSFENKVTPNQSLVSKIFQQDSNNSSGALSPSKSIQNVNTTNTPHSGGIGFPSQASLSRSSETPKPPNVSITPAKPVSVGQKPDFTKVSDSANTVTITPSLKFTENQELKSNEALKVSTDINAQNVVNAGPNQNGMSTAKVSPKSPVSNTKLPETASNENKPLVSAPFSAAKMPPSAPAAPTMTSGQQAKVTQSPVSKQVPSVPVAKPSPQTSPKSSSTGKPSQVSAPSTLPNQEGESAISSMPLSPKPSPQKAPSSKLPSSLPTPSTVSASLPKTSPLITTVSPSQSTVSSGAASKPQVTASPREVSASSVTAVTAGSAPSQKRSLATSAPLAVTTPTEKVGKQEAVNKVEATTPTTPIAKREVGRFPRIRKPLNGKDTADPKGTTKQTKEPAFESIDDDDDEEEEEEEEEDDDEIGTSKKRASRAKRKTSDTPSEGERRSKRIRNPASVYQSPVPDTLSRLTKSLISTPKTPQEKLVYFFKNEHVALRNAEGTFYLCQIAQNVYKNTRKIKIRWLSPIEEGDEKCETYKPDYYDVTDFDCILTTVALQKSDQKSFLHLPDHEKTRIMNILRRAIDRDRGIPQEKSELNEDHPDGLDLSLYNDESQLKKRKRKAKGKANEEEMSSAESSSDSEQEKEKEPENKGEGTKASPVKSAPESDPQRRTRGSAPPRKAPLVVPSKKPAAASASPLPPADSTPTITTQSPSSRRGVRTFGSSKSVTRGARVAAPTVQSPNPPASPANPSKKDASPNATSTKTDPSPKDQEPPTKIQRGRRSGQKTPVVKETPSKESTPTPKTTRRSRK